MVLYSYATLDAFMFDFSNGRTLNFLFKLKFIYIFYISPCSLPLIHHLYGGHWGLQPYTKTIRCYQSSYRLHVVLNYIPLSYYSIMLSFPFCYFLKIPPSFFPKLYSIPSVYDTKPSLPLLTYAGDSITRFPPPTRLHCSKGGRC